MNTESRHEATTSTNGQLFAKRFGFPRTDVEICDQLRAASLAVLHARLNAIRSPLLFDDSDFLWRSPESDEGLTGSPAVRIYDDQARIVIDQDLSRVTTRFDQESLSASLLLDAAAYLTKIEEVVREWAAQVVEIPGRPMTRGEYATLVLGMDLD